jgi:hypothetical protein
MKFKLKFTNILILVLIAFQSCILWSSSNVYVRKFSNSVGSKYEKLNYSFTSTESNSENQKKIQIRIEEKINQMEIFSKIENKFIISNSDKATYFLEIEADRVSNHWALNTLIYINAFASGLSFTVWPAYIPVKAEFKFKMYKYDLKNSKYVEVLSKSYLPTLHYIVGVSTIPFLWINLITKKTLEESLDFGILVEDFLQNKEWMSN